MGFASGYLETRVLFQKLISEAPDKDTGIIVVIPAFNEPDINDTLSSLAECTEPCCKTEVLIIINAPEDSGSDRFEGNILTEERIESWRKQNTDYFFRLYYFNIGQPNINQWGVGLARKSGMDEAIRRFEYINNPDGIIASLDADCRIEKNYFVCLFEELLKKKERKACSVYFEHSFNGNRFKPVIYRSIALYELHLRYYFQALKFTGFPYVHHTIGSAIAIKASAYVKAGGMNRRRAGEDFYFIQKLVPAGGFFNLYGTTIYPSPRISMRVPFGTGIAVGKLSKMVTPEYYTYDFGAFKELHQLFGLLEKLYNNDKELQGNEYSYLPQGLKLFLDKEEWSKKLTEIKSNTSDYESFKKRFYNWFNMFKIVKYLNYVHVSYYKKKEIVKEAEEFLEFTGYEPVKNDPVGLLLYYRTLEKSINYFPC
jgi:hypothetical protein